MDVRAILAVLAFGIAGGLTACSGGVSETTPAKETNLEATRTTAFAERQGFAGTPSPITLTFSANCGSKCGGEADAVGYFERFHGADPRLDTVTPQEAGYSGGFCIVEATPQGNAPMNNGDPGQVRNDGEFFTVMDAALAAQNSSINFIGDGAFANAAYGWDSAYTDSVYAYNGALPVNTTTGVETVLHISDATGCQAGRTDHYARLSINWYPT